MPQPRSPAARSPAVQVAWARSLLMGLFGLQGLMMSSWLARLPAVRDALGLSTTELGVVLLTGAVGALGTVAAAGLVMSRFGGRFALHMATFGFTAAFVLLGFGPALHSVPMLAAGVFLTGASFAIGNVPLNVESAAVERRMGRTILPHFHAAFSIGAVIGSLVGAIAAHAGVSVLTQFVVTAVIGLVWRTASIPHVVIDSLPPRQLAVRAERERLEQLWAGGGSDAVGAPSVVVGPRAGWRTALGAWREPRTLLVGVVIMAAALSEGSANDWLAIAVVDGFHQPQAVGAIVFGVFVAAMTTVRLLGTRLIDRFGRVAVLRVSGAVSFVGLVGFGFAPTLELAGVGVVLWGLGAALAVPIGIAAASDDPLRAAGRVSVVSAFASLATLAAPPLLGVAAETLGTRRALVLIAVAMVASIALSRRVAPEAAVRTRAIAPVPTRAPAAAEGLPESTTPGECVGRDTRRRRTVVGRRKTRIRAGVR